MPRALVQSLGGCNLRWPIGRLLEEDVGYWRVAHVKPRNEKALARDCELRGVGYYLPLYVKRVLRRDNNKPRKSVLPLFPGYLPFVDRDDGKRRIYETNRVVHVLPVADQEGFVRDLTQVWQAVSSGAPLGVVQAFTVGQRVRVKAGPLQGVVGVIEEMRNHLRLLLNVEAIQMAVSVELDACDVEVLR